MSSFIWLMAGRDRTYRLLPGGWLADPRGALSILSGLDDRLSEQIHQ